MILQRLKNLWKLSKVDFPVLVTNMTGEGNFVKASEGVIKSLIKRGEATVIPYKPRNPVKEIIGEQKEIV